MSSAASALLTVAMFAGFILLIGGARMVRTDRQRGLLMIAAALVIVANVLIWTI